MPEVFDYHIPSNAAKPDRTSVVVELLRLVGR
jgi:hypothetical protein